MGRFYDIFMLMTVAGLAISLVNASGIFNVTFGSLPQNNDVGFTTTDVINYTSPQDIKIQDQYQSSLKEPSLGWDIIVSMIVNVVYVYPLIVDKLHGPALIGAFLQAMVSCTQAAFVAQVAMRFGWKQTDD